MRRAKFAVDEELIARLDPEIVALLRRGSVGPAVAEIETPFARRERTVARRNQPLFPDDDSTRDLCFLPGHPVFLARPSGRRTEKIIGPKCQGNFSGDHSLLRCD